MSLIQSLWKFKTNKFFELLKAINSANNMVFYLWIELDESIRVRLAFSDNITSCLALGLERITRFLDIVN